MQAGPIAMTIFLYLSATGAIFLLFLVSLIRLKSIGVFDLKNRNATFSAQAENLAHSIGKILLLVFISVICARSIVTPDYMGGITSIDFPMVLFGLIIFGAALPQIGMIAALSPSFEGKKIDRTLLGFAIAVSVVTTGFGQVFAVTVGSRLDIQSIQLHSWPVISAAILSGMILTAGVFAHFMVVKKLAIKSAKYSIVAMTDAALAAIPSMAVVFIAAVTVRLNCL